MTTYPVAAHHRKAAAIRSATAAVALLAWLLLIPVVAAVPAGPTTRDVARCIRHPHCQQTYVVAHRAKGLGAPENSRAAVAKAIEAGVPLVKIDVRASRDGDLFVLHDGSLDRTTSLRGRIENTSSAQLGKAVLENGETLPRFTELYEIARGRAVLTVGFKVDEVERVADWIHANGSFDDLIFFVNTKEEMRAAARAKQRYPRMMVMVRLLDTRITVNGTRAVFGALPEILHTDRVGADEVARLHALGVKVFMNVVRLEGYIQPFKYFAVGSALKTSVDLILTDEPLSVMPRVAGGR